MTPAQAAIIEKHILTASQPPKEDVMLPVIWHMEEIVFGERAASAERGAFELTDGEVRDFVRRVGVRYLARKLRGVGPAKAERIWLAAHEEKP